MIVCVTNHPDVHVRGCVARGVHFADCVGGECSGCAPREAERGLLCRVCWRRLELAVAQWGASRSVLSGIDRAVQADSGGVRGTAFGFVPIPATRLAVDEVDRLEEGMVGPLEVQVASFPGAVLAVTFTRTVERVLRAFPLEEQPHRVHSWRCPDCGLLSLLWTPPAAFGDRVRVSCQNVKCGRVLDDRGVETLADILGDGIVTGKQIGRAHV